MDGLVLRWWLSEASYLAGEREVASASRNCCLLEPECTLAINKLADAAHSYLTVEYAASLHPRLDVSRWTTHRTTRVFGHDIEPIGTAVSRC